ncbi:DUF1700 domain-containing protein [Asticcacaulis solisilvae]|uniref:DUF1700 domain-containing protein n=1 Tax=Asticcacaulis solisilvae TaxID=1217274 RepID=UPI003FD876B5
MTKAEFLEQMKKGLIGLPQGTIDDIVADYEAHFADAAEHGRPEAEVASALGEPARLARELKAEAGLKSWETRKTPSSAISAVMGIIGLGAIDLLILLPMAGGVVGTLIGLFAASVGLFIAGGVVFAITPFMGLPGGAIGALLAGAGLMTAAAAIGCLTVAASIWLVNGIVWYARLHYRVAKPALDA